MVAATMLWEGFVRFKIMSAGYRAYPEVGLTLDEDGCSQECFVEVTSLSTLEIIQNKCGSELIVDFHAKTIIIYDDYIE